jgi:hypothetical protein
MAGVHCHTTMSSLLDIPSYNPIKVHGMDCLSFEVVEWSTRRHM